MNEAPHIWIPNRDIVIPTYEMVKAAGVRSTFTEREPVDIVPIQTPFQIGWDYWWNISDSPWTADSALWTDAAHSVQVTADAENISWIDNAGATGASDDAPGFGLSDTNGRLLDVGILNGHDGSILGVNSFYDVGALSGGTLTQPFEMFAVITLASQATQQIFIDKHAGGGAQRSVIQINSRKFELNAGSGAPLSSIADASDGISYGFWALFDGANSIGRVVDSDGNDDRVTGLNPGTLGMDGAMLWAGFNGTLGTLGDAFSCGIKEIPSLADEEFQLMRFFKDRWNLGNAT